MKQILLENAFEAWAAAKRFCLDIIGGKVSLQYQKYFVSSLHNAVELIMKQMLIDNNDHRVAEIRKAKNEDEALLQLKYLRSDNLNCFFENLTKKELSHFRSIEFHELIALHKKLISDSINKGDSFDKELRLLQALRNNETHFYISQDSYLSEKDFCALHNFMIRFYHIMEKWHPVGYDKHEMFLLPYCPDFENDDRIYGFNRDPLMNFSYKSAIMNSSLAKEIAKTLAGDFLCGVPDFTSYAITKDLLSINNIIFSDFDEICSTVSMMQYYDILSVEETFDHEKNQVYFKINIEL